MAPDLHISKIRNEPKKQAGNLPYVFHDHRHFLSRLPESPARGMFLQFQVSGNKGDGENVGAVTAWYMADHLDFGGRNCAVCRRFY
jgi:hypothetical protein